MQTQGNVSACLSLQGNPSPNRTAVGDSVLRACGSVLSENPCNSHLTLEDAEACRGSLPAVSQLPGGQTLQGSAPQRGLLLTAGRVPAGRRASGRAGGDSLEMHWAYLGFSPGLALSPFGPRSRRETEPHERLQGHPAFGSLVKSSSPAPREEAGRQFPARVGPAPSPSFGVRMFIGGEVWGVPCRHGREEASWSSVPQFLCPQGGAEGP